MTDLDPAFPLLGAREYVHSTSILNFLDSLLARPEEASVDLRIVSHVLPGARAVLLDPADAAIPAAAIARIGGRTILFVNPSASIKAERRADGFEQMLAGLAHADGKTTLARIDGHRHSFWDRAIFGSKCHLAQCHCAVDEDGSAPDVGHFLLSRIICAREDDAEALTFTTEIVLDGKWFRIGIHAKGKRLGYALAGK